MVDFNNETTVSVPAKDVMKIYLLQSKAFLEDSWRIYKKAVYSGSDRSLSDVKSAMEQLYIILEPMLERHWNHEEVKKNDILNIIDKGNEKEIRNLIILFNRTLDKTQLTRIDTKFQQKRTLEASNVSKGY